ncbi:hypothetical protein HOG47_07675, partial [archaeon]|nr:hypothetical protein [archaeon]
MDIDIYTNKHLLVKDTISIVIQKQSLWINNENGLNHTLQRQYKDMVRLYKMAQDEDLMYSITIIANKLHDFSEHSKDYKNLKNIL